MKHFIILLSIVGLLVFVGCGQGEKTEKATVGKPEKATEMMKEKAEEGTEMAKEPPKETIEMEKRKAMETEMERQRQMQERQSEQRQIRERQRQMEQREMSMKREMKKEGAELEKRKSKLAKIKKKVAKLEKRKAEATTDVVVSKESIKEPVYNLVVSPKKKIDPLILLPGEKTNLTFYIGPEFSESVIPESINPDPYILNYKGEKLELTVALNCSLCEKKTYHQDQIAYRPSDYKSSKARFTIVPSAAAVRNSNGIGYLIFSVDDGGNTIDRIQVEAFVGDPTPEGLSAYSPPAKVPLETIQVSKGKQPDIIIDVGFADVNGKLPIIIRPRLKDLHEEFKEEFGTGHGSESEMSWEFKSGVTKDDLDGLTYNIYMVFRGIMDQNNKDLQEVYHSLGYDIKLEEEVTKLHFSDKDRDMILYNLKKEGENLYWRIFCEGAEGDLKKAMDFIDNLSSDTPLRMSLRSANVYAPWQILYPSKTDSDENAKIDPKKFWGYRYLLGITHEKDSRQGRQHYLTKTPQPDEIAFAGWRGKDFKDEVAERARLLADYIRNQAGETIESSFNRKEFVQKLEEHSKDIKFIFAYGHATSGTILDPHKPVIGGIELAAAHFEFSDNEFLRPRDFDDLAKKFHFKLQPIVILDACETGTFGINPMNNNGFVGALTRLGAGAVIVTESPVLANFAYHFGKDIVDEILVQKADMSQAMLNVRLKHLKKMKNPLGLVYTLYGNSAMHIEP